MTDQTPPPPGPYSAPAQPLSPADEKLWATLVHIGGIFFYFVAPLIVYLVLKDRGPFIRAHSIAALNFQLTVLIGYVASAFLMIVFIGFLTYAAVAVVAVIFSIIAAIAANKGEVYKYPISIAFVK